MADPGYTEPGTDDTSDSATTSVITRLLSDDAQLKRFKKWFDADRDHRSAWEAPAREEFAFVAGHQWTEDEQAKLKAELRPPIVFNRIGVMVKAVIGSQINNRQEVRYIPREMGDAQANEVMTAAAQWFDEEANAENEESDAFRDAVVSGLGWLETRLDTDLDPDGAPVVERIDPFEMFYDCGARKPNLTDARRIWRVRRMSLTDARAMFPDEADTDLNAIWADRGSSKSSEPHNADPPFYMGEANDDDDDDDDDDDEVTLVHLQWWEREPFVRYIDPLTGQAQSATPEEFATFQSQVKKVQKRISQTVAAAGATVPPPQPIQSVKQFRRVYKQAFIGRKVLGEIGPTPVPGHFSWQAITGERDQKTGLFYGIVRAMMDPQRWANKWMSQSLHILNTSANSGLMIEEGATDDIRDLQRKFAQPASVVEFQRGALSSGKVQPKPQSGFPQGHFQLMEFAVQATRDVSGINLELMGLQDQQQAGVLEYQRRQSGMSILAYLFDSLRKQRKERGAVILYYIKNFLADGRLIKIVGKENEQYVPLVADATEKYDIIVDDAPSAPNQKEATWAVIQQMLPMVSNMLTPDLWMALLQYSPLPASVVSKFGDLINKPPTDDQQQQADIQKQMLALQVEAAQAKIAKDKASAAQALSTSVENLAAVDAAHQLAEQQALARMGFPFPAGFQMTSSPVQQGLQGLTQGGAAPPGVSSPPDVAASPPGPAAAPPPMGGPMPGMAPTPAPPGPGYQPMPPVMPPGGG